MENKLIDYFIEKTDRRLTAIETKLDKLLQFKWQIIGGSVVLSVLLTTAFQLIVFLTDK